MLSKWWLWTILVVNSLHILPSKSPEKDLESPYWIVL